MEPLHTILSSRSASAFPNENAQIPQDVQDLPSQPGGSEPQMVAREVLNTSQNQIRTLINEIEIRLAKLKTLAGIVAAKDPERTEQQFAARSSLVASDVPDPQQLQSHEGVFNGETMIGSDGKIYPVPHNYASKSKLVEGDLLKVTAAGDGKLIFKQIGPIERERKIGDLILEESGSYTVVCDSRNYCVLAAAVTYHKGRHGEKAVILVPKDTPSTWAAIEYIIHP